MADLDRRAPQGSIGRDTTNGMGHRVDKKY